MKITLTSLMVDDQEKAHRFYTEKLGFITKHDIPMGEARWLTVVSPADPDGAQLVLEPNNNPTLNGLAQTFQRGLYEQGITATAFAVDDIQAEYAHLKSLGVAFTQEPAAAGEVTTAILDDTCGNLIRIYQV